MDRLRDGLLATGVLAGLLGLLRRRSSLDALRDPVAAAGGAAGAVAVEWLFLRYPDRLLALWGRPAIHLGSSAGLLAAALATRRRPRLLAACAWGLVAYLVLLVAVLAGVDNPVSRLIREG